MGDVNMDSPEDIIAEPDEPTETYLSLVTHVLHAYGWYIIAAALAVYFYHKNRLSILASKVSSASDRSPTKSAAEIQAWQQKEEQRLKAVEKLQERYAQDAAVKAERQKVLDEEKRKARLEEMQKLTGKIDVGQKVGGAGDSKSKKPLKPEYNPLMGDQGSSGRVCFRRPGGGAGG